MFYVYIIHTEGADKIMEFETLELASRWVGYQHDPKLFYIVDWSPRPKCRPNDLY